MTILPVRPAICLAALCLLALLLRLALFAQQPSIAQPDEIFQYHEQAHRLVYGTGLIPWEYQFGVRNWIIPGTLAVIMQAMRGIGDDPTLHAAAIALAMSLLGLVPVIVGFVWGRRSAGLPGAILAGGLNAVWFEAAHYSVHVLPDTIGAALVVAGLCVGETVRPARARPFLAAGLLLGLTIAIRPQLTPAMLLIAAALLRPDWRARSPGLLGGMAIIIAALGVLDTLTLGRPWQSIWLYVWFNLGDGFAATQGVQPWYSYIEMILRNWGYSAALLLIAVLAGAWHRPLLAAVPLVIVLTFSAIAHKEERFVYPALPFVLTLAGIGTANLLRRMNRDTPRDATLALAAWAALSVALAQRDAFARVRVTGAGMLHVMRLLAADPAACGLAVFPAEEWPFSGGYTNLRPGLPLYGLSPPDPPRRTAAFNAILAPPGVSFEPQGYRRTGCWDNAIPGRLWQQACLWQRPGICDPTAAVPLVAGLPASLVRKP